MSSTVIAKNIQIGTSGTATNNFNWYQPASPDGTVRLGVGNYGATTLDAVTVSNSGNVTLGGTTTLTNISYSGTLTGGTGVVNIGSGQVYKDASGNVGLGTSSPARRLEVRGADAAARFRGSSIQYLDVTATAGGTVNLDANNGDLAFSVNTVERARIDNSGSLLIGTTSGGTGKLYVDQTAADYSVRFRSTSSTAGNNFGPLIQYTNASPNNTSNHFLYCEDGGGTQRFSVRSNGGIANYSANNVNLSDRREKTNFAPAGSYLSKICAIPVQTFNYLDQNMEEDPGLTLGVVAQDVQAVAPELVMESNWGTKDEPRMRLSVYQTDLQYALMKCIQEQQALIESLTARIAALEAK